MENIFSGSEIVELGVQIEKNGEPENTYLPKKIRTKI